MKRIGVVLFAGLAILVGGANAAPAQADDGDIVGNATGGGWIPGEVPEYTATELVAIEAKEQLWAAYAALSAGTMSTRHFRHIEEAAGRVVGVRLHVSIRGSGVVPLSCPPDDPCPPAGHLLPVPYHGQTTNYYCGPASGVMIADWLGAGPSAANGTSLSQVHMAGPVHMQTDQYGNTSYASKRFTTGLNQWLRGTDGGYYTQHDSPSVNTFRQGLAYDIDDMHAFGADTVEIAGGAHYNNHPRDTTIGHWLTVRGYTDYKDTTHFRDPSATIWPQVAQSFNMGTNSFVNSYMQSNGTSA
jgi:hypothetical protein